MDTRKLDPVSALIHVLGSAPTKDELDIMRWEARRLVKAHDGLCCERCGRGVEYLPSPPGATACYSIYNRVREVRGDVFVKGVPCRPVKGAEE